MPDNGPSGNRAIYFGCARGIWGHRDVGHFFYEPRGQKTGPRWRLEQAQPWGLHVDGGLAPRPYGRRGEAPEGEAMLHHRDGWTALSFWDRSGDSRGNSSSTFLFEATLTFDEALAEARRHFPELFERFPFEVVEYADAR